MNEIRIQTKRRKKVNNHMEWKPFSSISVERERKLPFRGIVRKEGGVKKFYIRTTMTRVVWMWITIP